MLTLLWLLWMFTVVQRREAELLRLGEVTDETFREVRQHFFWTKLSPSAEMSIGSGESRLKPAFVF